MGLQRTGHDRATNNFAFTYFENAVALDLLLQLLYIFIFKSKYYHSTKIILKKNFFRIPKNIFHF